MSERSSTSLLSTLGKLAIGGLAIGGVVVAYQNREKIAEVTSPAASRFGAWLKKMTDKAFGAEPASPRLRPATS